MDYLLRHSKKFRVGFEERYKYLNDNGMLTEEKELIMEFVEEDICIKDTHKKITFSLLLFSFSVFCIFVIKSMLIYAIISGIITCLTFFLYKRAQDNRVIAEIAKKLSLEIYDDEIKKKYNA